MKRPHASRHERDFDSDSLAAFRIAATVQADTDFGCKSAFDISPLVRLLSCSWIHSAHRTVWSAIYTADLWTDPAFHNVQSLTDVLKPYPDTEMRRCPVSTRVNSVKNDDAGVCAAVDVTAAVGGRPFWRNMPSRSPARALKVQSIAI